MVYRSQNVFNSSCSIALLYNRKVGANRVLINKLILRTVTPRGARAAHSILLATLSQEACRPFRGSHLMFFTSDLPAASRMSESQGAISK